MDEPKLQLDEKNMSAYNKKEVVHFYSSQTNLYPPEKTILDILKPFLKESYMLDIGVGGGRTTEFFAPLVKKYIGIDYAPDMIFICNEKYKSSQFDISFEQADARDLSLYDSEYFDFVLFSLNGIDALNHESRIKALNECKRVLKVGGNFAFSTHNLRDVSRLINNQYAVKLCKNPLRLIKRIVSRYKFLSKNPDILSWQNYPYMFVYDGAHSFTINQYYILPEQAVKQLEEVGFSNIRAYGLWDGMEITQLETLNKITDPFIYYLCQV